MEVPTTADVSGWYRGSSIPGEVGPTVIVAHVDMGGKAGVFYRIKVLVKGNLISVTRADGKIINYQVTKVDTVLKNKFPTKAVYQDTKSPELRLVTCGGKFDSKSGHYKSNVIVFAKVVV